MSLAVIISGIPASTGNRVAAVKLSPLRTVSSLNSLKAASPMPAPTPRTKPISMMASRLGLKGFSGSRGGSIRVKRSPFCSFSRPWATRASMCLRIRSSYLAWVLLREAISTLKASSTLGVPAIRLRYSSAPAFNSSSWRLIDSISDLVLAS